MPGFLPFARGSFMLDLVAVALLLVLPALGYSIYLVKYKRRYTVHKWMQLVIGAVLMVVVVIFELEMRILGWRHLAEPSPYYNSWVYPALVLHIVCAVLAVLSWTVTIIGAFKKFATPTPAPNSYSYRHKRLGKFAALSLGATAMTGWIFYYLAFVAS